jgi:hypothetical protein
MQKLEQRIATLEQAVQPPHKVTHIFIVPLGRPDSIQTISRHGQTWQRIEGETADEFQQRVAKNTPMHGKGVAMFTSD